MTKIYFLLLIIVALFSSVSKAQSEGKMIANAEWEVVNTSDVMNSINGSSSNHNLVKLDDGYTAALIKNDKEEFAVATISANMEFKWRTALPGVALGINWFKGRLLVIAAGSRGTFKGYDNNYTAYLLNPENGKIALQKQIHKGSEQYMEFPNFFFSEKGDYFKFSVRQSALKSGVKVALPGVASLISLKSIDNKYGETQSFVLYAMDEQLETTAVKLALPAGTFAGAVANVNGDVFVLMLKDKNSIVAARYLPGEKEAVKILEQPLDVPLKGFFFNQNVTENFYYTDSKTSPNDIFWTVTVDEGKGTTLYLSQMDLDTGTYKFKKELFTNDCFKEFTRNYEIVNKKLDEPSLGSANHLAVRALFHAGNKFIVEVGGGTLSRGQYASVYWNNSVILNVFDTDLDLKAQQIIPRSFPTVSRLDFSKIAYNYQEGTQKLQFIANTFKGMNSNAALYGEMDMQTGKIDKLNMLTKNKIGSRAYVNGASVFWSDKGFIIPYFDPKGLAQAKYDIFMKEYSY